MTPLDSLDQKAEFFKRPETVREVLEDKTDEIKVQNFYDIIQALESRKRDQAVIIESTQIIPPGYSSPANFAKRGPWAMLRTFGGDASKLKANKWSELRARIDANERLKREQGPFVGWGWKDTRGNYHVVRPSIDIEGHRLDFYSRSQRNIHDRIKVYNAKDSKTNTVRVEVPSRSSDETHQVVIENVPRIKGDEKYASWTLVSSRHDCDAKRHDFTFRHGGDIRTYCPHDVSAYIAYSRKVMQITGEIIPQIFPRFTEPVLRAFTGAARHTLIVEEFRDKGKKRHRTRPLSFPEIDTILMDAWLAYGNKQTFFLRDMKKEYRTGPPVGQRVPMRKYDWTNNAPGLHFGKD